MVKVSVIIPVYNGEKELQACFESVLTQTLEEIEMIVINDGSTDKTQEIIETYQTQYPEKIRSITKENEGQGKARNIGIQLAEGEFLTFVDADDTIHCQMLEKMYEMLQQEKADVCICDYYEIIQQRKIRKKAIPYKTEDRKKDYMVCVAGPCNKLIRTELLQKNELYFRETGIYEDISMIPQIAIYANKIVYYEEPFYYYRIRQGSTMRQAVFNAKLLSIYDALETLKTGFQKSKLMEKYQEELEYIYIEHLLYGGTGRFLEYEEGKQQIGKIVQIMKTQYPNWKDNRYYKRQGLFFKMNCKIFYSNSLWCILLFQKLKKLIKRGISWKH